jgi:hypothetical protein
MTETIETTDRHLVMSHEKKQRHENKLPIVFCECGAEILVISDLNEMVSCIETHATEHKINIKNPEKAEAEYSRIEELLTQKVLILIGNR